MNSLLRFYDIDDPTLTHQTEQNCITVTPALMNFAFALFSRSYEYRVLRKDLKDQKRKTSCQNFFGTCIRRNSYIAR